MYPTHLEYQQLAMRTRCPQGSVVLERLQQGQAVEDSERWGKPSLPYNTALLHGCIGLAGEAGELATAMQRWLWYGKGLDVTNIKEEVGDALWYIAEICTALGCDMGAIMEANIAKLKERHGDKFSDVKAAEENRDREAERKVLESLESQVGRIVTESVVKALETGWTLVDPINMDNKVQSGLTPILTLPGDCSQQWAARWIHFDTSDLNIEGLPPVIRVPHWLSRRLDELSTISDYERTVQREQTGQGWAEPPEAKAKPVRTVDDCGHPAAAEAPGLCTVSSCRNFAFAGNKPPRNPEEQLSEEFWDEVARALVAGQRSGKLLVDTSVSKFFTWCSTNPKYGPVAARLVRYVEERNFGLSVFVHTLIPSA
jgi:NTP pyrophosphatase (non-canonical NTP hydrolase)